MSSALAQRYVAIDGPPGAGVSALARALASATGAERIDDPASNNPFADQLMGKFADDPQRFAFQAQVFCLLARYRQQVEIAQPSLFAPAGLVADYVFARDALYAAVTLSAAEFDLYRRVYGLLDTRLCSPDLVVYLTADPTVLKDRLRALIPSADRVIKLNVLDRLAEEMNRYFLSYEGGPLLVINTSEYDFVENPNHLEELLEVIAKTRKGVHHYRPLG